MASFTQALQYVEKNPNTPYAQEFRKRLQSGQFAGEIKSSGLDEKEAKKRAGLTVENLPQVKERRSTLQKIGGFLGVEKLATRIGSEVALSPVGDVLSGQKIGTGRELKKSIESGERRGYLDKGTLEDITTGGVSNKEALGSAALTAANLALPFAGKAIQIGKTAIKVPALAQKPLAEGASRAAQALNFSKTLGRSGAVGAGFGVAGELESGDEETNLVRGALAGALTGALFPVAGKAIKAGAKVTGAGTKLLAQTFAKTPEKAIDFVLANPQIAKQGIRNAVQKPDTIFKVANEANKAAQSIKSKRDNAFRKGLESLQKTKSANKQVDVPAFNKRLNTLLKDDLALVGENGKLLSRAETNIIDRTERGYIEDIVKRLQEQKDFSPLGLFKLKKFISSQYRPAASNEFNRAVTVLDDEVRQTMLNNAPKSMRALMGNYEADSQLLGALQRELGVDARARGTQIGAEGGEVFIQDNTKRVINALRRSFKDNQPLAEELLKEMERRSGKQITGDLVGLYFNTYMPPAGLQTILGLGAGSVAGVIGGVGALPAALPLLGLSSPRLVGEGAALVGRAAQNLRYPQLSATGRNLRQGARQAVFSPATREAGAAQ